MELQGKVPVGSTLAALVFSTGTWTPTMLTEKYPSRISQESAEAAWEFLNGTGTESMEQTVSEPKVASPSTPTSPAPNEDILTFIDAANTIISTHFPGITLTSKEGSDLFLETRNDLEWVADIMTVIKDAHDNKKPQTDPIRFLFYFVRKVERHDVGNQARRIHQQEPSRVSLLDKARASAATKLKDLPPVGPNDDNMARMRELRKKAEALGNAE